MAEPQSRGMVSLKDEILFRVEQLVMDAETIRKMIADAPFAVREVRSADSTAFADYPERKPLLNKGHEPNRRPGREPDTANRPAPTQYGQTSDRAATADQHKSLVKVAKQCGMDEAALVSLIQRKWNKDQRRYLSQRELALTITAIQNGER